MRREHRPFWVKKLITQIEVAYTNHFLAPQLDALGSHFKILEPWNIEIYGKNIFIGKSAHLISTSDRKIRLTTIEGKNESGNITIGDFCLISPGVRISSQIGITIGNNCMFASNVYLSDSDWHGVYYRTRPFRASARVVLEDNVWIGDGAIICKGVTIGKNSVVGAGAVVSRDIPQNSIAVGVPAKVVKKINPKRHMITREDMFGNAEKLQADLANLDRYLLKDNTLWGWLKSKIAPTPND